MMLRQSIYRILLIAFFFPFDSHQHYFVRYPRNDNTSENLNASAKSFSSECGEVFTKEQFVLESPLYPSNYPHGLDCSYLLKSTSCPRYYSFEFIDFNLEESPGCIKDRLEIQDQDALCGVKNGTKKYYSDKGALEVKLVTDKNGSGRGYRILVTRLPCDDEITDENVDETTVFRKWYTTNKDSEWTTTAIPDTKDIAFPVYPSNQGSPSQLNCCLNSYSARRFYLTSPGFPESGRKRYDCQYRIYKNHPNICRLRLHVLFFWLGPPSRDQCADGFLKVDRKLICGCKSELKLITSFDSLGINQPKVLHFQTRGNIRDAYSGFVIEVIQDECPSKYVPPEVTELKITAQGFNLHTGETEEEILLPNITQAHETSLEKLKLVAEGIDFVPARSDYFTARVIRYFYYFAPPEYEDYGDYELPPAETREYTTYLDISSMSTVIPDLRDYDYCLSWNKRQLNIIYFDNKQNLPICRASRPEPSRPQVTKPGGISTKCYELSYVNGFFHSPAYPDPYPHNLNLCYRFRRQSGYCSIRMVMQDFDVENSENCRKDYVLLGNRYRYCGNALHKTTSNFDLRTKEYEDMFFITDNYDSGRGFSGVYEQIRCADNYPVDPVGPGGPLPPSPGPTNPPAGTPCDGVIRDRIFSINVYDYNYPRCRFLIKRYHPDVCKIKLYFADFDLICTTESLNIGDRMLCGHLTGQTATITLGYGGDLEIIYKKTPHSGIKGARLRIRGTQIIDDCGYPEVPPAELQFKEKSSITPKIGTVSSNSSRVLHMEFTTDYFIELKDDICGIVTNTTEDALPIKFCDMLLTNEEVIKCIPIEDIMLISDIPYESKKLELTIEGENQNEEIKFKGINCDNLRKKI